MHRIWVFCLVSLLSVGGFAGPNDGAHAPDAHKTGSAPKARAAAPSHFAEDLCKRFEGYEGASGMMNIHYAKALDTGHALVNQTKDGFLKRCEAVDEATFTVEQFADEMYDKCSKVCATGALSKDCDSICRLERHATKDFAAAYRKCEAMPEKTRREPFALATPFCERGSGVRSLVNELAPGLSFKNPEVLLYNVASELAGPFKAKCKDVNEAFYLDDRKPYPINEFVYGQGKVCDAACDKRAKSMGAAVIKECQSVCQAEVYSLMSFRFGFESCARRR